MTQEEILAPGVYRPQEALETLGSLSRRARMGHGA